MYQSRYLSDGGRVFFDSADALVPQDVNGTIDVYEFEPPQVGSCEETSETYSPRSDGCVSLISSGTSREESAFLDASESGDDVFFLTAAQLSPRDTDTAYDVYDAHVCSAASPCPPEEASEPPPCDTGDSCRPAPSPQPDIFGAPASETFSGNGNLTQAPPSAPKAKAKPLTRAQKLAKALKACHRKKPKKRRSSCERQARKKYGAKKPSKKKGHR